MVLRDVRAEMELTVGAVEPGHGVPVVVLRHEAAEQVLPVVELRARHLLTAVVLRDEPTDVAQSMMFRIPAPIAP